MKQDYPMYFLKFTELEEYNENEDDKCVGVFQYRIYEDKDGLYAMHDCIWESSSDADPVFRELQLLCEVNRNVTDQVIDAVDPELNDFHEPENTTLQ